VEKRKLPVSEAAQFGIDFEAAVAKDLGFQPMEKVQDKETGEYVEEPMLIPLEQANNVERYFNKDKAWRDADDYQLKIDIDPDKFNFHCKKAGVKGEIFLPYIGFIDLFKDNVGPLDLKTSGRKGWKEDWGLQLLSYMIGTETDTGEIHLLTRTKNPQIQFFKIHRTDSLIQLALRWISQQAKGIEFLLKNGEIPGTQISWMCGYCESESQCPASELRNVPALD